jgi:hypothetical protein
MTTGVPSTLLTGGGWVLLDTKTASSSATIDFTSVITSAYDTYMFVFQDIVPATDGANLLMRTSTNNGVSYDSTSGDYYRSGASSSSGSATLSSLADVASSFVTLMATLGTSTGENCSGVVRLYNPLGTAKYRIGDFSFSNVASNSGELLVNNGGFTRRSAADIDAVRFYMSSGNIASGIFRLYALKKD